MSVFDAEIIEATKKLDEITDEILINLSQSDISLIKIDNLYNSRKPYFTKIDEFLSNDENKAIVKENKSDWQKIIDPIKEKDEKAIGMLKSKVKEMEEELKNKHKQKKCP